MIRFGGPSFEKQVNASYTEDNHIKGFDPYLMVDWLKSRNYRAGYAPRLSLDDKETIRETREAFEEADIMIAEVGYWENLLDLNEDVRKKHRKGMIEALALAEELNASCAVNVIGSYVDGESINNHVSKNLSEEAFDEAVYMAREFIDAVKPKRSYFCFEIFPFTVVDSAESIEKLIKAVDRKQFGVHLDLANLINTPRLYWNNREVLKDCIRRFGDRIVAAHVKDLKMKIPSISVILEEVPAGQGIIDIGYFAKALNDLPQEIPFMLEHLKDEKEYDEAASAVRKQALEKGVNI